MNHRPNTLPLMHQLKRLVDVLKRHVVSDEHVQWNVSFLGLFDIAGQFRPALHATWPRGDKTAPRARRHIPTV